MARLRLPPVLLLLLLLELLYCVKEDGKAGEDCEEVWLELSSECREEEVMDCEADCDARTRKDCQIIMRKVWRPVLVSDCSPPGGVRGGRCEGGVERQCQVVFSTSCRNTQRYRTIEEDQPVCRTEIRDGVKVSRCRVVRRTRRKMVPETVCSRVPRKECSSRPCEEKEVTPSPRCGRRLKLVGDYRPEETCRLVTAKRCPPDRRCHSGTRIVCTPTPSSGRNKTKHTVCNGTIIP